MEESTPLRGPMYEFYNILEEDFLISDLVPDYSQNIGL
jgi:hypothetical protein